MAKDPAFLFYPNDYMGGTIGMTFEEKGAYMELLILQFNKGAFTINQAMRILGESFEYLWPVLIEKFKQQDNLFYNERLESERQKRLLNAQKNKERIQKYWDEKNGIKNQQVNSGGNSNVYTESVPPIVLPIEDRNRNENIIRDSEKEKKQAYSFLVKDFFTVCNFIETENPDFVEPFVDLWNLFAKDVGKAAIRALTDKRRKKILIRIREPDFNMISILNKAKDSNLLRQSGWFSFDWITENQENYLKVLEGNYDNDRIQTLVKHGTNKARTGIAESIAKVDEWYRETGS